MQRHERSAQFGLPLGSPIPDVNWQTVENQTLTSGSLAVPALILVVSLDCPLCVDLLPWIDDVIPTLGSTHFFLLSDGSPSENGEMVEHFGWRFPVLSFNDATRVALNLTVHPAVLYVANDHAVRHMSIVESVTAWLEIGNRLGTAVTER